MPLGESPAVGADDERDVGERAAEQAERPVQQQLPRRRGDEVVAANDVGDAVGRVIDDDGELVGRRAVRLPDDEVAADLVAGQADRPRKRSSKAGTSVTRKRQANGRSASACRVGDVTGGNRCRDSDLVASACGALAACSTSERVQVQG